MEEQNDPPKIKKINTDRKRRATQNGKEKWGQTQLLVKSKVQHVLEECPVHSKKATWHWDWTMRNGSWETVFKDHIVNTFKYKPGRLNIWANSYKT
jgi:hypothetical protein